MEGGKIYNDFYSNDCPGDDLERGFRTTLADALNQHILGRFLVLT
jgi:hypothetical protein